MEQLRPIKAWVQLYHVLRARAEVYEKNWPIYGGVANSNKALRLETSHL